jgi:hypothetical protein
MSLGYTGLILDAKARIGFFNKKKVKVYVCETFETHDMMTSSWHLHHTVKCTSRFSALKTAVKINRLSRGCR